MRNEPSLFECTAGCKPAGRRPPAGVCARVRDSDIGVGAQPRTAERKRERNRKRQRRRSRQRAQRRSTPTRVRTSLLSQIISMIALMIAIALADADRHHCRHRGRGRHLHRGYHPYCSAHHPDILTVNIIVSLLRITSVCPSYSAHRGAADDVHPHVMGACSISNSTNSRQ